MVKNFIHYITKLTHLQLKYAYTKRTYKTAQVVDPQSKTLTQDSVLEKRTSSITFQAILLL